MKKSLLIISIIAVVAVVCGCLPLAYASADAAPGARGYVDAHSNTFVGVAYYELEQGGYAGYVAGYADREREAKVSLEETVFDWGELSELLVWYSLERLANDGRVDLSASIGTYVPGIKTPKGEPTVADLMAHTAGFATVVADLYVENDEDIKPLAETVKCVPEQLYAPGDCRAYSVYDATLGAYIVEVVSGKSYEDYVRENVIAPMGLQLTAVSTLLWDDARVHVARNLTMTYNGQIKVHVASNLTMNYDSQLESCGKTRLLTNYYPALSAAGTASDLRIVATAISEGSVGRYGLFEVGGNLGMRISTTQASQAAIAIDFTTHKGLVVLTNSPQSKLAEGMITAALGSVKAPTGFYRPTSKVDSSTAFGWVNLLDISFFYETDQPVVLSVLDDGSLLTAAGVYEKVPAHELAFYIIFGALAALACLYAIVVLCLNLIAAIVRAVKPVDNYPVRLQRWQTTASGTILLIALMGLMSLVSVTMGDMGTTSMLWKSWVIFGLGLIGLGHVVVLPFIARKQPCSKKRVGLYCVTAVAMTVVLAAVVLSAILAF